MENEKYFDCFVKQKEEWEKNLLYPPEIMVSSLKISDFDRRYFDEAYEWLLTRHESLRTVFILVDKVLKQKVLSGTDDEGFAIRVLANENIHYTQNDFRLALAEKYKNIAGIPLFKLYLQPIASNSSANVFFVVHHIIGDDWSINVLHAHIKKAYRLASSGLSASIESGTFQLKDYCLAKNSEIERNKERVETYWIKKLDADMLNIFIDRNIELLFRHKIIRKYPPAHTRVKRITRELAKKNNSMVLSTKFVSPLSDQIKLLAIELKVSIFVILSTAISVYFAIKESLTNVLYSSVGADRFKKEYSELIGHLTGAIFLRYEIDKNATLRSALTSNYVEFMKSMRNILFSFDSVNHLPLVAASFVHLNYVNHLDVEYHDYPVYEHTETPTPYYPLTFSIIQTDSDFIYQIYYNKSFYTTPEIDLLDMNYRKILDLMITKPDTLLSDIVMNI